MIEMTQLEGTQAVHDARGIIYAGVALDRHPCLAEAYRIACLIEACGASEALTKASCAAFDFIATLDKALQLDPCPCCREWIAANAPGGWIDDLRKRADGAAVTVSPVHQEGLMSLPHNHEWNCGATDCDAPHMVQWSEELDPTSWDKSEDSGSFYCPRWLQPFVFWCLRLAERLRR